jgi:hypothetical protein
LRPSSVPLRDLITTSPHHHISPGSPPLAPLALEVKGETFHWQCSTVFSFGAPSSRAVGTLSGSTHPSLDSIAHQSLNTLLTSLARERLEQPSAETRTSKSRGMALDAIWSLICLSASSSRAFYPVVLGHRLKSLVPPNKLESGQA